ncbi:hypothetical protein [Negadavirga shengliensis]|uniref:Uncharacterized protein n=1 Tax=Negadavirga shengliensis TaxID=1389218 RepID=A0ABV9T9T9_9BACT
MAKIPNNHGLNNLIINQLNHHPAHEVVKPLSHHGYNPWERTKSGKSAPSNTGE